MSNISQNALLMRVKQSELPNELIETLYCRILQEGPSDVVACTIENTLANEGLLRRIGESELSQELKDVLWNKIIADFPVGSEVYPEKSVQAEAELVLRVLESKLSKDYKERLCSAITSEETAYDAALLFTTLDLLCKVEESELSQELKEVLCDKIIGEFRVGNEVFPEKSVQAEAELVLRVLESRLSKDYKERLCSAIISEETAYDAALLFTTLDLLCKVEESNLSKEKKEVLLKKILKEGPVEEVVRVVKYSCAKADGGEDDFISVSTLQQILHSTIKSVSGLVHETRYLQVVDANEAVLSRLIDSVLDDLVQCLKAQAFTLGANAIVNFRTSVSVVPVSYSTGGGAMGITAYTVHFLYGATVSADGMAVFVEPDS